MVAMEWAEDTKKHMGHYEDSKEAI